MSYAFASRAANGQGLVATYSPTFPVSISLWWRHTAYQTVGDYLLALAPTTGSTNLCGLRFGDGTISTFHSGGTFVESVAFYSLTDWNHIGVVWGTSDTRLYLNGVKASNSTGTPGSMTRLSLACLYEDGTRYWSPTGKFAEMSLWAGAALTDGNFSSLDAKVSPEDIGGGPTIRVKLLDGTGYVDTKSVITLADGGVTMTTNSDEPGLDAPGSPAPGSPAVMRGLWRSTILGLGHGGF